MRSLVGVSMVAVILSGCAAMPDQQKRVFVDAGIGAGVGALIGSAVATGGGAVAVGAVAGGAIGGILGAYAKPDRCYFRNRRGEVWQIPCENDRPGGQACFVGRFGNLTKVECPRGFVYR
jgi:hypothetical protein